jgi:DNA-directed RNA polymerase subunit RPC12/RpoP
MTKEPFNDVIVTCPNCNLKIIIEKRNCGIFRHGTLKENGKQIDPHLCEKECLRLKENGLIHGCGRPFKILQDGTVSVCDYV